MRVIIAGSRDFYDYYYLETQCNIILRNLIEDGYATDMKEIEIISGAARGVDRLGERYALYYDLKLKKMPANWDEFGKRAGYLRNEEIAIYSKQEGEFGVLIAFWDKKSKGTRHMISLAKKHGLKVFVINF